MARVTVEDCVEIIPNRFELIMCAAQRARDISLGSPLFIERDNDKNTVVSLREIADKQVSQGELQEGVVRRFQKSNTQEDEIDLQSDDNASDALDNIDEDELLAAMKGILGSETFEDKDVEPSKAAIKDEEPEGDEE